MDRVAFTIMGKDIYWYGVIIACALLIGMALAMIEAKKRGYTAEVVLDFLIIAVPLAVIGARAYYVIFNYSQYQGDFIKMIAVWDGGIAIYGAVIGGAVAALFMRWFRKFPALTLLDICAPSLVLGQALGRWGNFINQEAYGNPVLNPNWQFFPYAVYIDTPKMAGQLAGYYMATFFYEFAWNLIVFGVLMIFLKGLRKYRGAVFAAYVTLYGIGRFFIEGLRTDSLMVMGTNIRVSQALALVMVALGGFYLSYVLTKKPEYKLYDGIYSLDNAGFDDKSKKEKKNKNKNEIEF
ncbi:MAG: prolipoprotein diacylglyceryl transferase [Eubacteriales bacterium]